MTILVPDLILHAATRFGRRQALVDGKQNLNFQQLAVEISQASSLYLGLELQRSERVAVYLEKRLDAVTAMFGASAAGGVFVPVNPLLKPEQVGHILTDCNVRILVTSPERLELLRPVLGHCRDLRAVVLVGDKLVESVDGLEMVPWGERLNVPERASFRVIDGDMAAILYTSGSTGRPKGVVLSHRNLVAGAESVSQYLENTPDDRILSVLPLSFDYGLNQLTTAFRVGPVRC